MSQSQRARILLINDHVNDAEPVALMLRSNNLAHYLVHLRTGEDTLRYISTIDPARETLPDLILLDLELPEHDGISMLRAIKAHPHLEQVPAIALTSSVTDPKVQECYALGIRDHLLKPVSYGEFARVMIRQGLLRILLGTSGKQS